MDPEYSPDTAKLGVPLEDAYSSYVLNRDVMAGFINYESVDEDVQAAVRIFEMHRSKKHELESLLLDLEREQERTTSVPDHIAQMLDSAKAYRRSLLASTYLETPELTESISALDEAMTQVADVLETTCGAWETAHVRELARIHGKIDELQSWLKPVSAILHERSKVAGAPASKKSHTHTQPDTMPNLKSSTEPAGHAVFEDPLELLAKYKPGATETAPLK